MTDKAHVYRKGLQITNFPQLLAWLNEGNWIYLRDKPLHYSILENMPLGTIKGYVKYGILCEAIKND